MKLVRDLLATKGSDVWSVTPETTVFDALRLMAEKRIGAVLVLENDDLVGLFSERDYARKVILLGKSSKEMPVKEIMSSKVVSVRPDQSIDDCMSLMTDNRIRHLPVVNDGKLHGIITIGDVVKAVIAEKESVIEQLEHYITGTF
jgi:CBS domain-containing protein